MHIRKTFLEGIPARFLKKARNQINETSVHLAIKSFPFQFQGMIH